MIFKSLWSETKKGLNFTFSRNGEVSVSLHVVSPGLQGPLRSYTVMYYDLSFYREKIKKKGTRKSNITPESNYNQKL